MDEKSFWKVMEDVCRLGEFIAGIGSTAASIDIVGSLQVAYPGPEYLDTVLEKQDCHDHIHITPEQIKAIRFGYCKNAIEVIEPCIELINLDGQVCLTLVHYPYQQIELKPKYEQFMAEHQAHKEMLAGEW
jgi:hypothetical protein